MPGKAKSKGEAGQDLATVLAGINGNFGAGTLMRLGDEPLEKPETFSTGSIALDEALGIGGLPYGRVIEIYGPESSGKTSLALHATGNVQRMGRRAAFIDAEHALDPAWAATLGVDTDDLVVSQPDNGEQALQVADRLIRSGLFGIITIDSVAALVPKAELDGEIGDSHIGLVARMMSQGLRMITKPAYDTGTAVIFINQLREKVGVFFGSSETQPGGKALKFYSSVRLDVRRVQTLKDGAVPIGSKVRVKVVKNKVSPPFKTAEFDFIFGEGVSRMAQLIDLGIERRVVKKSGAFFTCDTAAEAPDGAKQEAVSLGQGKEAAKRYLAGHPDLAEHIERAIRATQPPPQPKAARGRGGSSGNSGLVMDGEFPLAEDEEPEDSSSDT